MPPEAESAIRSLPVPHLAEYFGLWAVLEEPLRAAVRHANAINLHLHVMQAQTQIKAAAGGGRKPYETRGSVAMIELEGTLMKFASSFGGTSTVGVRRQLRAAEADDDVGGVFLRIDSPGGTVSGTQDMGDDIAALAAKKPVYAFIEDMGCSAAYWAASQATKVFVASETTIGASLGTFGVIEDSSGQAAQEGVKVHVIRAGEYKGGTVSGAPVEHKVLAHWQELVDDQNEQFIRAVARGRNLSLTRTRELFDGRAHVGQKLVDMGLADGIQSFDLTLAALEKRAASTSTRRPKAMSTETAPQAVEQPRAATIHELKQGCVGADDAFLVSQLSANATLPAAQTAWMAEQNSRLQKAQADAEQARAAAARPGTKALATSGQPEGAEAEEGATERWNALVQANVAKGMRNDKAVRAVAIKHPDLHRQYLAEYNTDTQRRRAERAAAAEAETAARS